MVCRRVRRQRGRRNLLAFAVQILLHCLTGTREIVHGLMPLVRHPHRGELAPRATAWRGLPHHARSSSLDRRPPSGQARGPAPAAEVLEQSVETISCRPCRFLTPETPAGSTRTAYDRVTGRSEPRQL